MLSYKEEFFAKIGEETSLNPCSNGICSLTACANDVVAPESES